MKPKEIFRTRFARDIVCEVLFPKRSNGFVAIVCPGLPSLPEKHTLLRFLGDQGFTVLFPRYRGTWESEGEFLKLSPYEDILDIIKEITQKKKIFDLLKGEWHSLSIRKIIIFGISFGGPAAILSSTHPKIKKIIALSPVIDWKRSGPDEPFAAFKRYTEQAFGGAYRGSKKNWQKLQKGNFYSPLSMIQKIDGKKILLIHAKDDRIVPFEPTVAFSQKTNARLIVKETGGHLSSRHIIYQRNWKIIQNFLTE